MTRGRKPDAPALQAAKGNPGRRPKKRASAAKRAAELAAAPAESADPLAPPAFLGEPELRPALAIWRSLAPELRRYNLLDVLDRNTFAMYCVHMADWIEATKITSGGNTFYTAKNINNDDLLRPHPAYKLRVIAEKSILEIGSRFGLDPQSRYKLLRDQSAASLGGLFSGAGASEAGAEGGSEGAAASPNGSGDDDVIGLMRRAGGNPPGPTYN